jgi:hypothetical protein
MDLGGDAAPVIRDGDSIIFVDDDFDLGAGAGEVLVNGVVHDLPDEVHEAVLARAPDVHPRAHAHGL